MSLDMSALHEVFFEESFEGLNIMESALLGFELDSLHSVDSETINAIFRAAHSIKGGGGTFGFTRLAEFTHDLETLLDEIRSGKRPMTAQYVELFLQSVDVLRDMLNASREKQEYDEQRILELTGALRAALGKAAAAVDSPAAASAAPAAAGPSDAGFTIAFAPELHLYATGNDPVRMFRELATLGDVACVVSLSNLPAFAALEAENAYLAWDLTLQCGCTESEVREVFAWWKTTAS